MKRILKRYLALLLTALIVITGTPVASFAVAVETPSITNLTGAATGTTTGEFTWDYNLPDAYNLESVSAELNNDPVSIDLLVGNYTMLGLEPKTNYTLDIDAAFCSTEDETYTVKRIEETTREVITKTRTVTLYSKRHGGTNGAFRYYEFHPSDENPHSNPHYTEIGDLLIVIFEMSGYTYESHKEVIHENLSGWREHIITEVVFKAVTETTDTKYEVSGEETKYDSYEEAKNSILSSLDYTEFGDDEDFDLNNERHIYVAVRIEHNISVSASFTTDTQYYNVTFVDHDDEELKVQEVESGSDATAPADPTREGYTFDGWDLDFTNVTSSFTVKATYKANVVTPTLYTVTFADYDDTFIDSDEVASGGTATAPADPTREGYTFDGWDLDFTNVTSSFTVKATYKANVVTPTLYTVTFVDYDDTFIDSDEVASGGSASAPSNPTRSGYTFTGWDKAFTNVTSDLTVYAVYSLNVVNNNDDEEDDDVVIPERQIPASNPPVDEPEELVELELEETPAGPAIIIPPVEEKEKEPKEEIIILDLPNEAIPEGSGLPQTGQLPAELFVGLGGLISAAGAFLRRKK